METNIKNDLGNNILQYLTRKCTRHAREKSRTSYLQGEAISMDENLHTQLANINKFTNRSDLCIDNQITWKLPRSTQPWPGTVPGFNLDPLELVPTCKYLRAPKVRLPYLGYQVLYQFSFFVLGKMFSKKFLEYHQVELWNHPMIIPKHLFVFCFYR